MDSVQHNFYITGDSVALRGGMVDYEPIDNGAQWTLGDAHFTEDVAVSGPITVIEDGSDVFDGEFTVTGPGSRTTTVHLNGRFLIDGADMTITFDVGGRPATFTVPAY